MPAKRTTKKLPVISAADATVFRRLLHAWYRKHSRDLSVHPTAESPDATRDEQRQRCDDDEVAKASVVSPDAPVPAKPDAPAPLA